MLKVDPEFRALIPPLTADEKQQLEDNLKADGCRDPLVAWKGTLLDGHNRYEICERLGIAFKVSEVELPDRLDAIIWIRQNQAGRRNLDDDQRAMNGAALVELLSERAKRERASKAGSAGGSGRGKAANSLSVTIADKLKEKKLDNRAAVARSSRVSEHKIRQAGEVRKKNRDLAGKVERGEIKLKAAVKQIKQTEKREAKAAIPADLPAASDRYRLIQSDVANLNGEVSTGSVDWIITDPPYPKEFLPVYEQLSLLAARVLKPGGSLLAMVGQSYLPEIIAVLGKHLRYHWTVAYLTPGGQSVQLWDRKVNTFWKPCLWFVNGKYEGEWIGDVTRSNVNDNDKKHHRWGQSESGMADLIERFTFPGQTVLDPFVGGGTTGVVAVQLNRRFIGVDIDQQAIQETSARLAALK